jgi:hypothetical protein
VLWACLAAALVLGLPTLAMGFSLDDWTHLLILEGKWPIGSALDLFRFAGGDAHGMRRLVQEGPYPWWTLPELSISFWRPLASALEAADHRVFGRNAVGYHAHSLAWYLGAVAAVGALLRRWLPGSLGSLALVLFTIDEAHLLPAGWISNRNAVISLVFGVLALAAHLEWRERGRRWGLPASLLCLALALAGGETAIGLLAYLAAYELLAGAGARKERLLALAPIAALTLGYLALYRSLGFGAFGSAYYLDPIGQPGTYVAGALTRIPALAGGALGIPVDLWALAPGSRPALVALGLIASGLATWWMRALWPGLTHDERRHGRWLFAGAALSLVPVASSLPMGRLLLAPSLGGSVLLAVLLRAAWRSRQRRWRPRAAAAAGAVLALLHLVLAPLSWPALALAIREFGQQTGRAAAEMASLVDPARIREQRLVIVSSVDLYTSMHVPMLWALDGRPLPRSWWTLSLSPHRTVLTRTSSTSIELTVPAGHFLDSDLEQSVRSPRHPLQAGDRIELEGLTVSVLAADAEGPTAIGFDLGVPLEDRSLVLLSWQGGALRPFTPPGIGERVEVR